MMAPSGVQVMCGLVLLFSGKPVVSAPFNRGAATVSLTANGPCGGAMLIVCCQVYPSSGLAASQVVFMGPGGSLLSGGESRGTAPDLPEHLPCTYAMCLLPMILSELANMAHIDLAERRSPHESYLGCISWSISKPLTECEVFDRDADTFTPVTKEQLKTVVLTAQPCSTCGCCSGIQVQLPQHRSPLTDDLYETVTFAGATVTAGQLLRGIHHFYNV